MKILLKIIIAGAWLLFVAALWQIHQVSVASTADRSLPVSGLLSISRKMSAVQKQNRVLSGPQSITWPLPGLLLIMPATGR